MQFTRNIARKYGSKIVAASTALVGAAAFAQAATPSAAAVTALNGLTGDVGGYATPLFALAIAGVGIGIGVKWIKRGKGAA